MESKIDVAIEQIRQLRADVNRIEDKLDTNYVTKPEFASLTKRTDNLEDNNKWVVRLVLSLVIVAVVGLVIIAKK